MISAVVADDHPIVLEGVVAILRRQEDINVVATCADGLRAARAIDEFRPDVAVLDVTMPGMKGVNLLSTIIARHHKTKVIFLTASMTDKDLITAVALGVHAILLKETVADDLVNCVYDVAAGHKWLPTEIVAAALRREEDRRALINQLGPRERQIALLIAVGASNKEIGRQLNLTEGTVKIHVHNIYGKLEIPNRIALTAFALAHQSELKEEWKKR